MTGAIRHGLAIGHGHGPLEPFLERGRAGRPCARSATRALVYCNDGARSAAGDTGRGRSQAEAVARAVSERRRRAGMPRADGAVVTFIGIVRDDNHGRRVVALEYEAYEPLAVRSVRAHRWPRRRERWPSARLAIHHRIGRLDDRRGQRRRSPPRRRTAPRRLPPAATRSSASSRSRRSGSTSSSRAATRGSKARRPIPTTRRRARRRERRACA